MALILVGHLEKYSFMVFIGSDLIVVGHLEKYRSGISGQHTAEYYCISKQQLMLQIFSHRAPLILLQLRHSCAKGQVVVSSFMLDPVQDCMADHPQISATPSNFGPSTVWPALEVSKMLRWVLKANFRKRVTHDNAHMIIILIAFIFH